MIAKLLRFIAREWLWLVGSVVVAFVVVSTVALSGALRINGGTVENVIDLSTLLYAGVGIVRVTYWALIYVMASRP